MKKLLLALTLGAFGLVSARTLCGCRKTFAHQNQIAAKL